MLNRVPRFAFWLMLLGALVMLASVLHDRVMGKAAQSHPLR